MNSSPQPGACRVQLSTLAFSLLIAAVGATIGFLGTALAVAERGLPATPALPTTLVAAAALWVLFLVVLCRDQTLSAIRDLRERIEVYGDERESDGRIDTLRGMVGQPPQPRDGRVPGRLHAAN